MEEGRGVKQEEMLEDFDPEHWEGGMGLVKWVQVQVSE